MVILEVPATATAPMELTSPTAKSRATSAAQLCDRLKTTYLAQQQTDAKTKSTWSKMRGEQTRDGGRDAFLQDLATVRDELIYLQLERDAHVQMIDALKVHLATSTALVRDLQADVDATREQQHGRHGISLEVADKDLPSTAVMGLPLESRKTTTDVDITVSLDLPESIEFFDMHTSPPTTPSSHRRDMSDHHTRTLATTLVLLEQWQGIAAAHEARLRACQDELECQLQVAASLRHVIETQESQHAMAVAAYTDAIRVLREQHRAASPISNNSDDARELDAVQDALERHALAGLVATADLLDRKRAVSWRANVFCTHVVARLRRLLVETTRWKERAAALEYENDRLRRHVPQEGPPPSVPATHDQDRYTMAPM
ncbi:Aste57867_22524 [Aphanomyces stellatus]|uniref:Aste57867_22524 protein n=1 Tax=Aphanomyces stellatus TaxID=120398 RepID=A0A485LQ71_9STRA|nr:hypothetical protein As57867_022454 [Aphanomyces stellatus]VFT99184.1 Aste57867_22524 [Aphanomyces stellatus]